MKRWNLQYYRHNNCNHTDEDWRKRYKDDVIIVDFIVNADYAYDAVVLVDSYPDTIDIAENTTSITGVLVWTVLNDTKIFQ